MKVGPGGRQIQIEDPDGNPVELFEPASRAITDEVECIPMQTAAL